MSKTKKYVPTKNVGVAPKNATKAELVWLNLTTQTVKQIIDLRFKAYDALENKASYALFSKAIEDDETWPSGDDFGSLLNRLDREANAGVLVAARKLAAKAGWRRTRHG